MALHSQVEKILRNRCCCSVYQQSRRTKFNKPSVNNTYKLGLETTYENQYMLRDRLVTKLWKIPYPIQLELKQKYASLALRACYNRLAHDILKGKDHPMLSACDQENSTLCPVDDIRTTNEYLHYRNKSEYTVSRGMDGKQKVGHIVGKGQSAVCVPVDLSLNTRKEQDQIAKVFQQFIDNSEYSFMDPPLYRECNWLSLLLRSTTLGDTMAVVRIYCKNKSQEFLQGAQEELKEFFETGPGKDCGVTSLYIQHLYNPSWWNPNAADYRLVSGQPFITEKVLDCYFRMAPGDFFQVYTKGAELVYSTMKEFAKITHNTTVLDLCCGIGVIGILLAREAKKVLGVELIDSAVQSAKQNAELNNITNAEFICNKAHRVVRNLGEYITEDDSDVVAVLNPGRSGCQKDVIFSLRKNKDVKRVIYISCKPYGNAAFNFVQLVAPTSEKLPGEPFRPVKAVPVDLFPLTIHYELVLLFER